MKSTPSSNPHIHTQRPFPLSHIHTHTHSLAITHIHIPACFKDGKQHQLNLREHGRGPQEDSRGNGRLDALDHHTPTNQNNHQQNHRPNGGKSGGLRRRGGVTLGQAGGDDEGGNDIGNGEGCGGEPGHFQQALLVFAEAHDLNWVVVGGEVVSLYVCVGWMEGMSECEYMCVKMGMGTP